ncbi:PucR family transcriptional regulator [Methylomusa anaerophila]|uniref:Carbohydrate diacid transcriptional activator CdaR n=1 Tax=Methylomusa anaerophila TaxID=1930071 RepID=A0A348AR16_9FIRM|nr:helix-turn-helix domain-containing protein [Methylomusa anaerophila]BBB93514.1 carbohydrate diacid transcriptional activator CdaR [Methylomusa anaerophila]
MDDEISRLFQEELEELEQFKKRCNNKQYQNNELMVHYANMAKVLEKNLRDMMKITKISDSQQLYLQEIQQELEREIEERIKVEEKLVESYKRHRRNQFLLDLAEGNRVFDDSAWTTARQLMMYLPATFHAFYLRFTGWRGKPLSRTAENAAAVQTDVDVMVDHLNTCQGIVAWEWGEGIGLLHPALPNEDKERQIAIGISLKKQLAGSFPHIGVAIGIGGQQGGLDSFMYRCHQARAAAVVGRRLWLDRDVYHHQDGGAYQLLYPLAGKPDTEEFIERMVGKLLNFDQENGTDLLITLEKILQSSNLKIVSEEMYLHHKTIVARKQRIENILQTSLDTFDVRFNLSIALHLLRFRTTLIDTRSLTKENRSCKKRFVGQAPSV